MSSPRYRLLAWLIENRPALFLRWKRLQNHRLARDEAFLRLHARIVRSADCIQVLPERYNLWSLGQLAARRPGAFAEVGVWRGGSAEILCAAKGDAPLHLFDTFAGMPAVNPATDGAFRAGEFSDGTLDYVRTRLAGYQQVHFHPGIFPASGAAPELLRTTFQFVHLDVDLHRSTLDALAYFYPRIAPGAFLVTHDYGDATVPGVKQACDEFLADKPERMVPLWQTQGLLIKQPPAS